MKRLIRTFDGEKFIFVYHTAKKTAAQDHAKYLRRQGYKARVMKVEYTLGLPWAVFRSRRKRQGEK